MIAAQHSGLVNADYNRARYIFALFTAGTIFTLILAGALVTSYDAGLSVPDWPTSFGSIYKIPPMVAASNSSTAIACLQCSLVFSRSSLHSGPGERTNANGCDAWVSPLWL